MNSNLKKHLTVEKNWKITSSKKRVYTFEEIIIFTITKRTVTPC